MWLVAFERYSLAALAVEHQLPFGQSLLHKEVVLSIATAAGAGGRSELLGVLYDELARLGSVGLPTLCCVSPFASCRKKWEDLAGKLGKAFDIVAASARDEVSCG